MAKRKIGIDSVIFIYLLENNQQYRRRIHVALNDIQCGKTEGIFSAIGLIEILTGPKKVGRFDLVQDYKHILTTFPNLTICGIDEKIVDTASDIRAKYNIATPDAIHVATAIENSATEFLTNDKRLKKVKEIQISLI